LLKIASVLLPRCSRLEFSAEVLRGRLLVIQYGQLSIIGLMMIITFVMIAEKEVMIDYTN